MLIFGNDQNTRGCFVAFRLNTAEGRGAQLQLPLGGNNKANDSFLPETDYAYPLTVTGFQFSQMESAHFLKCFGDYVYTYAFGHDPNSVLTVEFAGMLRKGNKRNLWGTASTTGSGFSEIMDDLPRKFQKARLYSSLRYAKFFLGSNAVLKGFLMAMTSNTADPQTSLQNFTMTLQLVEAQGK